MHRLEAVALLLDRIVGTLGGGLGGLHQLRVVPVDGLLGGLVADPCGAFGFLLPGGSPRGAGLGALALAGGVGVALVVASLDAVTHEGVEVVADLVDARRTLGLFAAQTTDVVLEVRDVADMVEVEPGGLGVDTFGVAGAFDAVLRGEDGLECVAVIVGGDVGAGLLEVVLAERLVVLDLLGGGPVVVLGGEGVEVVVVAA